MKAVVGLCVTAWLLDRDGVPDADQVAVKLVVVVTLALREGVGVGVSEEEHVGMVGVGLRSGVGLVEKDRDPVRRRVAEGVGVRYSDRERVPVWDAGVSVQNVRVGDALWLRERVCGDGVAVDGVTLPQLGVAVAEDPEAEQERLGDTERDRERVAVRVPVGDGECGVAVQVAVQVRVAVEVCEGREGVEVTLGLGGDALGVRVWDSEQCSVWVGGEGVMEGLQVMDQIRLKLSVGTIVTDRVGSRVTVDGDVVALGVGCGLRVDVAEGVEVKVNPSRVLVGVGGDLVPDTVADS